MQKLLVSLLTALLTRADARSWKSQPSQLGLCYSQVFTRPKGKLLWEEQRGCTPFGLPHARCLISPSSQEPVVFLLCQSTTIVHVPIPPPPHGGREGYRPCLLHFSISELYQIKSLLLFSFFTASILTAFFHTCSLCSLKLRSSGCL